MDNFSRLAALYERGLKRLLQQWPRLNSQQQQQAANTLAGKVASKTGSANYKTWREAAFRMMHSGEISRNLKREVRPLLPALQDVANRNAELISNLPETLRRAMTEKAATLQRQGLRGAALERELKKIAPHLTRSRIRLIARTEISRAETDLTRARSESLGVSWYQWETSQDSRVRQSHRKMSRVLISWNDPPQPEKLAGEKSAPGAYHAGCIFNCRCLSLPLISLDEVHWPARVHHNGRIVKMTRSQFSKLSGAA